MAPPTRLLVLAIAAVGTTALIAFNFTPNLDARLRAALEAAGVDALEPGPPPPPPLVELGRALFFDREMSGRRDIACATCHLPSQGTVDGLSLSFAPGATGLGPERIVDPAVKSILPRNVLDLFNRGSPAWHTFFWDGRIRSETVLLTRTIDGQRHKVEATRVETPRIFQGTLPRGARNLLSIASMFPVGPAVEMKGEDRHVPGDSNEFVATEPSNMHAIWGGLLSRFRAIPGYVALFAQAYPDVAPADLSFQHVGNALAAFQEDAFTLLDSPFDRYLAGDDEALSEAAKRGALLFYGKAKCATCHAGPLLSDQAFHNIGAPQLGPGMGFKGIEDLGRGGETLDPEDRFRFRTPPLRNVTETGPWFHNGALLDLRQAVEYHLDPERAFQSIDISALPREIQQVSSFDLQNRNVMFSLDPILASPIELSVGEVDQLMAFLEALTDPAVHDLERVIPATVPSGLRFDDGP